MVRSMRAMRCPRCQTLNRVPEGVHPVCTACGFGAPPAGAPAGPATVPAHASATPPPEGGGMPPPAVAPVRSTSHHAVYPSDRMEAGPRRKSSAGVVAIILVVSLLLSGLGAAAALWATGVLPEMLDGGSQLSDEERIDKAFGSYVAALEVGPGQPVEGLDGAVLTVIEGSMKITGGADDMGFFMGDLSEAQIRMEGGTGDTYRVDIVAKSGPVTVDYGLLCLADKTYMRHGDVWYEGRYGDQCEDGEVESDEEDDAFMGDVEDEMGGMESLDLSGLDLDDLDVTTSDGKGGRLIVSFTHEDIEYEVTIDKRDRLTGISYVAPSGEGDFSFTYGTPKTLPEPDADARLPADLGTWWWNQDHPYWEETPAPPADCVENTPPGDEPEYLLDEMELEIYSASGLPLDEFEARIRDVETEDVVASYRLDGGATSGDLFTFTFDDADGSGDLSDQDTLVATFNGCNHVSVDAYEGVLWDLWADRDVDDMPIPGAGLFITMVLLATMVVAVRRRRD